MACRQIAALVIALALAQQALAQPPNRVARLQTTDQRGVACNFPIAVSSVVSVTFTLRSGTDADCGVVGSVCVGAMQVGSPSILDGVYNSRPVASGQVVVTIDPDAGAADRNRNTYELAIVAQTATGGRNTCRGPLVIENQAVVF